MKTSGELRSEWLILGMISDEIKIQEESSLLPVMPLEIRIFWSGMDFNIRLKTRYMNTGTKL
jgi:hypothetical protein